MKERLLVSSALAAIACAQQCPGRGWLQRGMLLGKAGALALAVTALPAAAGGPLPLLSPEAAFAQTVDGESGEIETGDGDENLPIEDGEDDGDDGDADDGDDGDNDDGDDGDADDGDDGDHDDGDDGDADGGDDGDRDDGDGGDHDDGDGGDSDGGDGGDGDGGDGGDGDGGDGGDSDGGDGGDGGDD